MKANELRIGNWVHENGRLVVIHDGFGIDHAHNFNPIPITEERLLKFGFYKEGMNWYKKGFGHTYISESSVPDCGYEVFHRCNVILRNVGYVHTLQNLYFALTGKELTL